VELSEVPRYVRTLRHLRTSQVAHRIRLRGQRAALRPFSAQAERLLTRHVPTGVGWPEDFVPLDARLSWPAISELEAGKLKLLGSPRLLGAPPNWHQEGADKLWSFHLHYWDWAWGLALAADRTRARSTFAALWMSYDRFTHLGPNDAWSPYVVSLRAWTWCGLYAPLVVGGDLDEGMRRSLTLAAGFLRTHLELDVGGNHLLKNLKALIGLGVFLRDEPMLDRAVARLAEQIDIQVLPDGGHYERAPAYHCQVLGDLIDVAGLLEAAARPVPASLDQAVPRMRRWLGAVLLPDGTVPMLNDGYPVAPELLAALGPSPTPSVDLVSLPDSGLVIGRKGRLHLIADVGDPCPPELPAHAHADTLSYLLYVDGQPVVADPGTSTYTPGPVRDRERSTRAHSTVEVDETDSTEVWGAFRAGRRARARLEHAWDDGQTINITASHDGYRQLPGSPNHRRSWSLSADGLRVVDEVTGTGVHRLVARTQLAAGIALQRVDDRVEVRRRGQGLAELEVAPGPAHIGDYPVALGHGSVIQAAALEQQVCDALPQRLVIYWRLRSEESGPGPTSLTHQTGVEARA